MLTFIGVVVVIVISWKLFIVFFREGANKSPNIKMRLCKYLNLIN